MVQISGLANEITRQLALYAGVVQAEAAEIAGEVAEIGVQKLKPISPKGATGDYSKGWKVKKVGHKRYVWNPPEYRLTHLLEKGHATVDGGRTDPQPHIKPVENELRPIFEEKLVNGINSL